MAIVGYASHTADRMVTSITASRMLSLGTSLLMATPNIGLVISPSVSQHLSTSDIFNLLDREVSVTRLIPNNRAISDNWISSIIQSAEITKDTSLVLMGVDEKATDKFKILAQGLEVAQTLTFIAESEINGLFTHIYVLTTKEEAESGQLSIITLHDAREKLAEYERVRNEINGEISNTQTDLDNLSDILSLLNIAADIIEVGGAAGGIMLWVIKKIVKKHKKNKKDQGGTPPDPLVEKYIEMIERVTDFFLETPKARLAEISYGTGIPKEHLRYLLKGLSFEHELACFWHPPQIDEDLLKNAIKIADSKRKSRAVGKVIFWVLLVGAIVVLPMRLSATYPIVSVLPIPALILLLLLAVVKLIRRSE